MKSYSLTESELKAFSRWSNSQNIAITTAFSVWSLAVGLIILGVFTGWSHLTALTLGTTGLGPVLIVLGVVACSIGRSSSDSIKSLEVIIKRETQHGNDS